MRSNTEAARSHVNRIVAWVEGRATSDLAVRRRPPPLVEASWRRCLNDYRLDPTRLREVDVASSGETRLRAEAIQDLLPAALTIIPELSCGFRDFPHVLLLADRDGVILHRLGDFGVSGPSSKTEISPGAIWDERRQGTNGLGTSLTSGLTTTVHLTDHFAPRNAWLSCISTPIRDSAGQIAGALNVTLLQNRPASRSSVVEHLLETAGRRIEELFLRSQHPRCWIVSLGERPEFAGIVCGAVLAIDQDGQIAGGNDAARRLFAGHGSSIVGRPAQHLLGVPIERMRQDGTESGASLVEAGQHRLYATVRAPLERPASSKPKKPSARAWDGHGRTRLTIADVAGGDPPLQREIARLRRFVDRKIPIVIGGETGTGKEILARALHEESARALKPFVAINCAAMPDTLIESELFGYAEGAFTGANRRGYQGKIVQSSGGTLFLDEIGDMPLHMQTRLLRVLTEQEVCPLGSGRVIAVDLNVICASHHHLNLLVESGAFRADLLYRLQGASIVLPPLRARTDKADLLHAIFDAESRDCGLNVRLDGAAMNVLLAYRWPGNIRELRHVIRATIVGAGDGVVRVEDLPAAVRRIDTRPVNARPGAPRDEDPLLDALRRSGWCVASVAREFGVSRQALYRRMQQRGIVSPNRADGGR